MRKYGGVEEAEGKIQFYYEIINFHLSQQLVMQPIFDSLMNMIREEFGSFVFYFYFIFCFVT